VAVVGSADGVGLVAVELEGDAVVPTVFARAEDAGAFFVEDALIDQVIDPIACLEGGVELYQGIGPQETLVEALPYLLFDASVFDLDETSYVRAVVFD
jgi:hypothetical protein